MSRGVFRGHFGVALRKHLLKWLHRRSGGMCETCGRRMNEIRNDPLQATIDHVIPSSKGGKSSVENCKLVCKDCNNRKSDIVCYVLEETQTPNGAF